MDLIYTPFGFDSTAADVIAGIDLTGKRAVVTGASSGLGIETARALASAGADVTLAVRDVAAGERAAKDINATTGSNALHVSELELTAPHSVAAFVRRWQGPLHILVNNAGVMAAPEQYTEQGWESQFATNHLGHFALANGLHDALAEAGSARIVAVSSTGHMLSPVIFDDIDFNFRAYDPWLAYGQSKTANVLFVVAAARRWAADGITANAVMPGAILTNLQRHTGGKGSGRIAEGLLKTPEQGAATSMLVATSPLLAGVTGRYFEDCHEARTVDKREGTLRDVARYALDQDNASRLWTVSEAMWNEAS